MSRDLEKSLLCLSVAAVLMGSGPRALAQETPVLEEVIVTAQKREQSLLDVPLAVSALTAQNLRVAGISDVKDLARQVPSLQVQSNTSSADLGYRIRRVGNIGNIPTFEPAVGVFIDGAFRNRPLFSASDMFDVERIEILRGPQSTLYGKNTTAGVMAVYTAAPAESFAGNAELSTGLIEGAKDAPMYRFTGGISGPIGATTGGSLGLSYASHDHIDQSALTPPGGDANDLDRHSLRGQLQWKPTDALSVRLIAGLMKEDDDSVQSDTYIEPGSSAAISYTLLQAAGIAATCSSNDSLDRRNCSRVSATSNLDAREATLLVNYGLDNGMTVTSISSWDWFKFRGTVDDVVQLAAPLLKIHDTQEAESWQQELRLSSSGGEKVDWLAGVFWYQNEFNRGDHGKRPLFLGDLASADPLPSFLLQQLFQTPFPVPFAVPGQDGVFSGTQDTDYLGVFGQATWNITERFELTGGIRWQTEEKDASLRQGVTVPGISLISLALLPTAVGGKMNRDTDEVTWSLTPQYAIADNHMVYATVAHAFKSGGFNVGWGPTPIADREFKDEDIMHYETGVKSTLLDGAMQLAISAFYTEYKDYQDAAFIGQQFLVGNAEKAELKGAEADGKLLLGNHFSTDFGISYADLTYAKNTNGLCYPGRTPDATTGACDLSGEHLVNAPEWTTHLGLMYTTNVTWADVYARADWSWTDDYNTSSSADPRLIQDSYNWLNLRTGMRWNNYELIAWIDNALDESVVDFDAPLALFQNDKSYQTFQQEPRSYGLTLRAKF